MSFNEEENCIMRPPSGQDDGLRLFAADKQMGRTELLPFTPMAQNELYMRSWFDRRSSGQLCSALGTTACKNFPAVGSCHSLSEPMHFGSVALFGLIGTQHCIHLLKKYAQQLSPAAASPVKYPVIGWGHTISIITAVCGLVNHFFKKYDFFAGFSGNHKIWGCTC